MARLESPSPSLDQPVAIDSQEYAEANARMASMSGTVSLESTLPVGADELLLSLADSFRNHLIAGGVEAAHVKMMLHSAETSAIANIVGSTAPAELSRSCGRKITFADVLINARAEASPALLRSCASSALNELQARYNVTATITNHDAPAVGRSRDNALIMPETLQLRRST